MAAKNEAKIRFLADTSEFTEQIGKANQKLAELRSEMKLSESQFKNSGDAVGALTEKKRILQEQLAASAEKVNALREKLEKAKEIYGENSNEVSKLKTQLNNAERQYSDTENAIEDVNKDLKTQEDQTEDTTDETEDMTTALRKAGDGFTVMKGAIANLLADGIEKLIGGLKETTKYVLRVGMDFESGMAEVKAISGATADEMGLLTDKAKEMGAKTKFSAAESAEAFKYMSMAGWEAEDMLKGIDGVMNLAAASGEELGAVSDIVTDALTAMGYSADKAGRFADVLAAAASNSNTNVGMMGYSFKYAAPLAGALGYNIEDIAVALGLMANSGVKSEMAGTSLRSMFTRLSTNTDGCAESLRKAGYEIQNSDGSMKSLSDTMIILREYFSGLSKEQKIQAAESIAGKNAMSGLLAIVETSDADFDNLTNAINNSKDAAANMAETMEDTLAGDITKAQSALENLGVAAYENFKEPLRDAVQSVTEALGGADIAGLVGGISTKVGELAGRVADKVPSMIQTILNGAGWIIDNIDLIITGVETFMITWGVLKGLSIITSIGNAVTGLMNLVSAFATGAAAADGFTASLSLSTGGLALLVTGLVVGVKALFDWVSAADDASINTAKAANASTKFEDAMNTLRPQLSGTNDLLSSTGRSMNSLKTEINKAEQSITSVMYDETGKRKQLREDEIKSIREQQDKIIALKKEQLEIMREQQEVETLQLKRKLEKEGELTEDALAQSLVNAKAAYDESEKALEEAFNTEYARTYAHYKQLGQLDTQEASAALDRLEDWRNEEANKNKAAMEEVYRISLDEAKKLIAADKQKYEDLSENIDLFDRKSINMIKTMDVEAAKTFLQITANAQKMGVELDAESKQLVEYMINSLDKITSMCGATASGVREAGRDIMNGLAGGLEDQFPELRNASKMSSEQVIKTMNECYDIHSPSRVTKQMGVYLAEGLADGMESKETTLGQRVRNFASGLLDKLRKGFGINSPSKLTAEMGRYLAEGLGMGIEDNADAALAPMRGIADEIAGINPASEWGKLAGVGGALNYDVSAQLGDYVSSAIEANSDRNMMNNLINAIIDLANRPIELSVNDVNIATATAAAADSVSGNRINLMGRGLAI